MPTVNLGIPGHGGAAVYVHRKSSVDSEQGSITTGQVLRLRGWGGSLQKDPIGFNGLDLTLYAYVRNNPVILIDLSVWCHHPSGHPKD